MLTKIHQLRDKIFAIQQDWEKANLDLYTEIENCVHVWETQSGCHNKTCSLCGVDKDNAWIYNKNQLDINK